MSKETYLTSHRPGQGARPRKDWQASPAAPRARGAAGHGVAAAAAVARQTAIVGRAVVEVITRAGVQRRTDAVTVGAHVVRRAGIAVIALLCKR